MRNCNKHLEGAYVNYFIVIDSPCFFTGLLCVSRSWMNNNYTDIKTNEIILYDDTERESCNEANILLLNFSISCVWRMRYGGYGSDDGYCIFICYFTTNNLIFYYNLLYIYFYIYLYLSIYIATEL
jgi:hypothetical protein